MYRLHMQSRTFEDQTAMREDIRRINLYIEGVEQNYTIVDRLGEGNVLFPPPRHAWNTDTSHDLGTFSSVYKAIDKNYASHDNRYWEATSVPAPVDAESRKQLEREAEKTNVETRLQRIFGGSSKKAGGTATGDQLWVALKRIYVTSSPDRIYNELDIMEDLR